MHHRCRRAGAIAASVVCMLTVAACTSDETVSGSAPPVTEADATSVTYVALGGDETVSRQLDDPLRDAWTQQLFTTELPRGAVHVNFARPDATVAEALTDQVPQSLDLAPTVATVWFGRGDGRNRTSDAAFVDDLSEVVRRLQDAGAQVLLLAAPQGDATDVRYADLVEQVAQATSAAVVEVPAGDRTLPATQTAIARAVASRLAS